MDVELPQPGDLVTALRDPARRRPLAVLDPSWPAPLRRQAAAEVAEAARQGRLSPDDLVLFTSGSTGRPRGVVRTSGSWAASLQPLSQVSGIGPDDVVWVPGPLTSSLSLYGAYHAATAGAQCVCVPAPPGAARATAAHLVPTALAAAAESARLLPRLRTVVVSGGVLAEPLRHKATGLGWRVVEYYGAAELSFVGVRDVAGPMHDFPGAEVELRKGRIWVRSAYLARGYLRPDDAGPLTRDGDWASVGDLGRQLARGWVVEGRGDAAIITGGHTVVAEEVEAVLSAVEGVRSVAVVGLPHEWLGQCVTAVVVADRPVRAALLRAAGSLPPPARPRRWLAADDLWTTTAGKVARGQVAARAPGLAPLP